MVFLTLFWWYTSDMDGLFWTIRQAITTQEGVQIVSITTKEAWEKVGVVVSGWLIKKREPKKYPKISIEYIIKSTLVVAAAVLYPLEQLIAWYNL